MKKIYLTLLTVAFVSQYSSAQTLTQSANEPVVGDVNAFKGYDSVGVVPKATGSGITWNFSSFTQNTVTTGSTFTTASSVPNATAFPGATLAEDQGSGNYNFYKTTGSQFELLGQSSPGSDFTFTNSAIAANWPVAFNYSLTDAYSGNMTGSLAGTLTGTITTEATGTGSIVLPGGFMFSNVLQVRTKNTVNVNVTFPPVTATITGYDYNYYHSSQKFPLLTVSYQATTGFTNTSSASISVNNLVITGLNDKNFEATFQIFPNPAKESFNVSLTNPSNASCKMEVYNSTGQLSKTITFGNGSTIEQNVSLDGLSSGIYIVKTTLGTKSSSRKLVIE